MLLASALQVSNMSQALMDGLNTACIFYKLYSFVLVKS